VTCVGVRCREHRDVVLRHRAGHVFRRLWCDEDQAAVERRRFRAVVRQEPALSGRRRETLTGRTHVPLWAATSDECGA
jgi:hypothetical protein